MAMDKPKPHSAAEATPGPLARALDFLGLERNIVVMMGAGTLQALGTRLWNGYVVKVLDALGAAGWMIGFYGTIGSVMSALAPYPSGLLSDRLGRGRALTLASVLTLAGLAVYLVAPVWWMFLPGAVLLGFAGSFRFMGSLALTGDRLRERRRAISIGVQNVLGRLPGIISPPLGGALIALTVERLREGARGGLSEEAAQTLGLLHGFRWAVAITIALTLIAIVLQRLCYRLPPPKRDGGPLHPLRVLAAMPGDLKRLLSADCLVRFGSRLYLTFSPLYVLNVLGRGYVEWGSLQALATATSVVMYIPAAKLADRAGRSSRRPFVGVTFLFFSVFPLALVLAPSPAWLIPVFIFHGLREFGEPARKALIMDLAGRESLGRRIGAYYMARGAFMSTAPFIGGMLYGWNPVVPFILGGLVSGAGLVWFVLESLLFGRRVTARASRGGGQSQG